MFRPAYVTALDRAVASFADGLDIFAQAFHRVARRKKD